MQTSCMNPFKLSTTVDSGQPYFFDSLVAASALSLASLARCLIFGEKKGVQLSPPSIILSSFFFERKKKKGGFFPPRSFQPWISTSMTSTSSFRISQSLCKESKQSRRSTRFKKKLFFFSLQLGRLLHLVCLKSILAMKVRSEQTWKPILRSWILRWKMPRSHR